MNYKVWFNGKIINWEEAKIHLLCHCLHYGSGVFEGIRAYQTVDNRGAVFRLKDHIKRLFKSAKALKMKIPYSLSQIEKAILQLLRKNKLKEAYIRPIAFFGGEKIGLYPKDVKVFVGILTVPFGKYLGEEGVKVKISSFIRFHPKSVVSEAKVCGYYVNSIFATTEAKQKGFDEALLLDWRGFVAEGPGENIFIVKNKVLMTPKLNCILPGITRDTVIKLAKDMRIKVKEKDISLKELKNCDEAFFTGTAAEVTPIFQIDRKKINKGREGEITRKIRETYEKVVRGEIKKYRFWLTYFD